MVALFSTLAQAGAISDPLDTLPPNVLEQAATYQAPDRPFCGTNMPIPKVLSLADAVTLALCNHPASRAAWASVMARAAATGVAKSAWLPRLEAKGSVSRVRQETRFPGQEALGSDLRTRSTELGIHLSWVLYDFGLRSANLATSRALLDAASAARDDTIQTVFFEAAKAYYTVQAAKAVLAAKKEAESAAQQSLKSAIAHYKAEVGAQADKLQAETAYNQARLARIRAKGELQRARGELAVAMSIDPATPLHLAEIRDQDKRPASFSVAVEELINEAMRVHPRIQAARAELKAAQAQTDAARAEGRPTISLFGAKQRRDTPIEQVSTKQVINSQFIGIEIRIPIFEGFERYYRVREARAEADVRAHELARIEQDIAREVWESYQSVLTETDNISVTKEMVATAAKSFKLAQGRYKAGVGSILELLNAQSAQADAKQQRIAALMQWHTARLRLGASLARLNVGKL
jgi:outer membrane protein